MVQGEITAFEYIKTDYQPIADNRFLKKLFLNRN